MNYGALFRSALVALLRNKMRSILTVLGITIGIAAVICVVAIGKAGQARVEQQLNNLGDNLVWIEAGGHAINGVRTGTHDTSTLTMADAIAVKNQVSLIKSVSPNVDDPVQVIYGNQNWHTSYRGVSPEYFEIKRWYLDQGAAFSQDDVDRPADVCVIGHTVQEQLFGADVPVAKVIRVNSLPCKVVGTLHPKGLSLSGQRHRFRRGHLLPRVLPAGNSRRIDRGAMECAPLKGWTPEAHGVFTDDLTRARRQLAASFEKKASGMAPLATGTDIIGGFWHMKTLFESDQRSADSHSPTKAIWIFSDMMNESPNFLMPALLATGSDPMLERAKARGMLVPFLKDYKIYVLGASPSGLTPQAWLAVKKFWEMYFAAAGAELVTYSVQGGVSR